MPKHWWYVAEHVLNRPEWMQLHKVALSGIGTRFMAINHVPKDTGGRPQTVAFELLAVDYPKLIDLRDQNNIPVPEFDALLLARHACTLWDFLCRYRDEYRKACNLKFSVNVTPELLLTSDLMQRVMDCCFGDINPERVIFELDTADIEQYVSQEGDKGRAKRLNTLISAINDLGAFKIGLDDEGTGTSQRSVLSRLRKECKDSIKWRKLDQQIFRDTYEDDLDHSCLKDMIDDCCAPGYFGVIEGIETKDHWKHIVGHARSDSTRHIHVQGYYVNCQVRYQIIFNTMNTMREEREHAPAS